MINVLSIIPWPNDANIYEKRAQRYYEQEKYDLSDADYKKMIEIDNSKRVLRIT